MTEVRSQTAATFDDPETVDRFAELVVSFAANVQPGQLVAIDTEIGKVALTRAIAEHAYRRGARFVDAAYFDFHVKRSRIEHADVHSLAFVPSWHGQRLLEVSRLGGAQIRLTGLGDEKVLTGLDPTRLGLDLTPALAERNDLANAGLANWTSVPCPTRPWAQRAHPDLDPDEAWVRLARELAHVCRLDCPDPAAAWRDRMLQLEQIAGRLNELRLRAVHFSGPGTDLEVGLLPGSTWGTVSKTTRRGVAHISNLPSEEVSAAPDPRRVDGVVRATRPLVIGGAVVEGLEVEFEAGEVVRIDAEEGAEVLRGYVQRDDGARRLGEVALVDGESLIGRLGTVFFDTLLDENAASHVALGQAHASSVSDEDRPRANASSIHVDFMIGSPDVAVGGLLSGGSTRRILDDGVWQL